MEFSRAINENGFLYVPYAEVKQQEEELKKELELYKKAYNLLAKAYCDKGKCWDGCECYGHCGTVRKFGDEITKDLFLQKARNEE